MASPQLKDGYLKIANEIWDQLVRYRIPGEQMQCLLFILRKTYGYNKKWDAISNSQFVKATGINRHNVHRAVQGLIDKDLVIKKDNEPSPKYYFNKNYKTWKALSKKITVIKKDNKRYQKRSQSVIKKDAHKIQLTKDNTKDTTSKNVVTKKSLKEDLAEFDLFWNEYPRKVGKQDCKKIWLNPKKKKLRPPIGDIVDALTVHKISDDWTKDDGKYIPHPSTWLNRGGWDDELRLPSKPKAKDLEPKTYAQAQDAERRVRARWLLKEMKRDKQKGSAEGINEDVPRISHE